MKLCLPAILLSAFVLAANPAKAQTQSRYIQHETDDAHVYMDEEGVAVRIEKNWACRNVGWASTADPKVFSNANYVEFRQGQIDRGTWDQWLCRAVLGPVAFSREVLEAQRKMNMAPDKPDCVPWVPETGRLNWEALAYARCHVAKEVEQARAELKTKLAEEIAAILGDDPAGFDALVAKAQSFRLSFPQEGCGRSLESVYDVVICRLERQDRHLATAEGFFAFYAERVDRLRGVDPIPQLQASGLAGDTDLIRKHLNKARREADGL